MKKTAQGQGKEFVQIVRGKDGHTFGEEESMVSWGTVRREDCPMGARPLEGPVCLRGLSQSSQCLALHSIHSRCVLTGFVEDRMYTGCERKRSQRLDS